MEDSHCFACVTIYCKLPQYSVRSMGCAFALCCPGVGEIQRCWSNAVDCRFSGVKVTYHSVPVLNTFKGVVVIILMRRLRDNNSINTISTIRGGKNWNNCTHAVGF